jgi:hypothetical protein
MNKEQKFEQWAERALSQKLDQIMFGNDNDGWVVFGRYHIKPSSQDYQIWHYKNLVSRLYSKRSAISWVIAEHHKQHNLSRQIETLDHKKQLISGDIKCRSELARRSASADFKEMVNTKLEKKLAQNHAVSAELEKCISSAKYIQLRGFPNETARPSYS